MKTYSSNFVSQQTPLAWWLLAGENLYRRVLLIGDFDERSQIFIREMASDVQCLEDAIETKDSMSKINNLGQLGSGGFYDVIIISVPAVSYSVKQLSKLFRNKLNSNGVIAILEDNERNLRSIIKKPRMMISRIFKRSKRTKIESLCIGSKVVHVPSMVSHGLIYESFSPSNYKSNKNNFLLKEKLKSWILNSKLNYYLYAKNIWLISKKNHSTVLFEDIEEKLKRSSLLKQESDFQWSVIYYKHGKLIFSFISRNRNNPSKYVVIAFSGHAVEQRDNELEVVKELSKNKVIKKYFNGVIEKHSICNLNCYVMNENCGVTVDADNPDINMMTDNAFNSLLELTNETLSRDENIEIFLELLNSYFERIVRRTANYGVELQVVKYGIIALLKRYKLPTVCVHGDLKLENFILNKKHKVVGIIDWELCELSGFPLIDLLYLITYNRNVLLSEDFSKSFLDYFHGRFSIQEKHMLDIYCAELGISVIEMKLLVIISFIHHYAVRCLVNVDKRIDMEQFELCLNHVLTYMRESESEINV